MTVLEMIVSMDCEGCARKVKRALRKVKGVDKNNIDINMELQKVTVIGWADPEKILRKVRRTGRKADRWPFPHDIPDLHNSRQYFDNQYHYHSNPLFYFTSKLHPARRYHDHEHGYYGINGPSEDDYRQYGHGYYVDSNEYDQRRYNHHQLPRPKSSLNAIFSDDNVNACSIM